MTESKEEVKETVAVEDTAVAVLEKRLSELEKSINDKDGVIKTLSEQLEKSINANKEMMGQTVTAKEDVPDTPTYEDRYVGAIIDNMIR